MTWRLTTAALVTAVIALAVFAESAVSPSQPEARVERPNFVVLMTDDQTVSDLEVMPRTRRLLVDLRGCGQGSIVCCCA